MTAMDLGDRGSPSVSRRLPVLSGSDAALTDLRAETARLQNELEEIERRIVDLREGRSERSLSDAGTRSARLADELATRTIERERANMARYLEGATAVCEARITEAQHEARTRLAVAGDQLARALRQREQLVESALTFPSPTAVADPPLDESGVGSPSGGDAPIASPGAVGGLEGTEELGSSVVDPRAPGDGAALSRHRREAVISLLLWIVGGALVVVGLAFAVVVILMFLD